MRPGLRSAGAPVSAPLDVMTTNAEVRRVAYEFMPYAAIAPVLGAFAYTLDGVYIGATWARDMRNHCRPRAIGRWWGRRSSLDVGLGGTQLTTRAVQLFQASL